MLIQWASQQKATGGGTPIPALANLAERWSADTLTGLADGDAISAFPGSINAITLAQATAAAKPKYKTAGIGGRKYALLGGSQALGVTADPTLLAASSDGKYTIVVFYRNAQSTTFGHLAVANASSNAALFAAATNYVPAGAPAGTLYASGASSPTSLRTPYNGSQGSSDLQSVAISNGYPGFALLALNGCTISELAGAGFGAGNGSFAIGNTGTLANSGKAEVYDVFYYDKALTQAELFQLHAAVCEISSQIPPWEVYGKIWIADGDSQTFGLDATLPVCDSYPAQIARALNMPMGTWMNVGQSSAHTGLNLAPRALTDIDPIVKLTTVPVNISFLEYYNIRTDTNPLPATQNLSYTSARRAAGYGKIALLTCLDSGDHPAGRTAYLASLLAGYVGAGVDTLVQIDTDANVGAVGAAVAGSIYFNADLIHCTTLGYTQIADFLQPTIAAW